MFFCEQNWPFHKKSKCGIFQINLFSHISSQWISELVHYCWFGAHIIQIWIFETQLLHCFYKEIDCNFFISAPWTFLISFKFVFYSAFKNSKHGWPNSWTKQNKVDHSIGEYGVNGKLQSCASELWKNCCLIYWSLGMSRASPDWWERSL